MFLDVLERVLKSIWDYWWFVLVLWATSHHGHLTMHEVVKTAILWSTLELLSIPLRMFYRAWRDRRRRWLRYQHYVGARRG